MEHCKWKDCKKMYSESKHWGMATCGESEAVQAHLASCPAERCLAKLVAPAARPKWNSTSTERVLAVLDRLGHRLKCADAYAFTLERASMRRATLS